MGGGPSREEEEQRMRRENQKRLREQQELQRLKKQIVNFVQMKEKRKKAHIEEVASAFAHAIMSFILQQANEQSEKQKDKKLVEFKIVVTSNYNKSSVSNPTVIKQSVEEFFKQQSMSIICQIPYSFGACNYLVIGEANTGKTSLINCFFNLKQPVEMCQKTDEAKAVLKLTNGIVLWEAPANEQDFKFLDDGIHIFRNASRIFVIYDGSIKSHSTIITLAYTLKPRRCSLYIVRNKCDLFDLSQHRNLQEEMLLDRRLLSEWKLQSVNLLTASAGASFLKFDNQKLQTLMSTR